jgi:trk system potassium uptake protein TrkH
VNLQLDLKILGWLLVGMGAIQAAPLLAALWFGEPLLPFAASATAVLAFGLSLALMAQPPNSNMRLRDGFLVVSFSWVLASLFGSLPYLLTDVLTPADALFEAVSGFTTTGSTVIEHIEEAPRSLLLWRALTQWLGGMGIIVFAIAIVPMLGIGGMQLFQAEMPGPTVEKLRPRIVETARRLLLVYVGFTATAGVLYALAGMDLFEALCHALTTLATGGFSTRDGSVGAFGSATIEWLVIFFMVVGGINFALHYRLLSGRVRQVLGDTELGYFLSVLCVATFVVVWLLRGVGLEGEEALRKAAFQVVSLMTGTGYGTADFASWPTLATVVLLQLMILGGMAGSTTGGLKGHRVLRDRRPGGGRRGQRGLRPRHVRLGGADRRRQRGARLRSHRAHRDLLAPSGPREDDPRRLHARRKARALHGAGALPARLLEALAGRRAAPAAVEGCPNRVRGGSGALVEGAGHAIHHLVQNRPGGREVETHEALAGVAKGAPVGKAYASLLEEELVGTRLEVEGTTVEPREVGGLGWMVDDAREALRHQLDQERPVLR